MIEYIIAILFITLFIGTVIAMIFNIHWLWIASLVALVIFMALNIILDKRSEWNE